MSVRRRLRGLGVAAGRVRAVRRGMLAAAALGGTAVILVYHRVGPQGPQPHETMPTLPVETFRAQLETLGALGEIVPLSAVLSDTRPSPGLRFSVTFDDDHASITRHALPVLRDLGVPAAFFLSGRWLHGGGPYWWEVLEAAIERDGVSSVARRLGLGGPDPPALAAQIQGSVLSWQLEEILGPAASDHVDGGDVVRLIDAGMELGFHTVDHHDLTRLDPGSASRAVAEGRAELERLVGGRLRWFAYPHGRVNAHVAAAVADAGYDAALTTTGRPVRGRSDRLRLGRWDPGLRVGNDLAAAASLRAVLPASYPRGAHRAASRRP